MSKYVYVLRSDKPDGKSYGGFRWPESGPVEAPDWNDRAECGGGLHGLLWGCGRSSLLRSPVNPETRWRVVKVASADVIDLDGKVKFPRGEVVYFGDRDGALRLLDKKGAEDKPVVYAQRTAGDFGTATAGYSGTATAGYSGTATAGDSGTATAGYSGTATAGYSGTATAGDFGTIQIKRWDWRANRYRIVTGYIGEDGLLPDTPYRLDADGKFVAVTA